MQTSTETGPVEILTMEQIQYQHAIWVLEQVRGNKLRAAKLLGISRMTLYRLLGRHTDLRALPKPGVATRPEGAVQAVPQVAAPQVSASPTAMGPVAVPNTPAPAPGVPPNLRRFEPQYYIRQR